MLQQILKDMYIEPELLAELNEEQKQVLFIKMREEQVRRWKEREARLEKEEAKTMKPKKVSVKTVSWMKASDSDVWVWVMGEHPDDKPYDQICDEIMAERAALQAQKEAEELRAKKEAELEKRFSGIYMEKDEVARQEEARKAAALEKSRQEDLKRREEEERRKAEEEVRRLKEEREQQIYMNLKKVERHQKSQDNEEKAWQDSLRKSKAADQRRRSLAKQTREDHRRRSIKALERGRVAAMTKAFGEEKPALPPKPKPRNLTLTCEPIHRRTGVRRSVSSSSQQDIIRWFKEEQLSLRVCFQDNDSRIAPWFHGIISCQEAEDLLSEGGAGSFLVRVSERIFGYVLSYKSPDGFKHFLIDATDNCYMLLGDQIKFASLGELLQYHEEEPLTPSGGELLLHACGQKPGSVDYAELFT
ncbi:SH2 domain-containing protein 4A [Tachysurus fulvidraco]|uniref:SH2 domain-containing protein 4A n=1 Tax=Tachysurus fulvidraco TaxID=1234273 RepID=UPI001FED40F6|nr:SH2 domain-containing protein 4A [Tachysurus fulvidraco]